MVTTHSTFTPSCIWAKHVQPSSTEPPSLELLPVELQIQILTNVPDTHSLQSLIHASPAFHSSYLKARDEIFTAVTVAELKARSVDLLNPVVLCEVRMDRKDLPAVECRAPLRAIYNHFKLLNDHWRDSSTVPVLKLSIEQCLSLLKIRELVPWKVENTCYGSGDEAWSVLIAREPTDALRLSHSLRVFCNTALLSRGWPINQRLSPSGDVLRAEEWRCQIDLDRQ